MIATVLNYFNLGVSILKNNPRPLHSISDHSYSTARHHERQRALVRQSFPFLLPSLAILPLAIHALVASWCLCLLDFKLNFRGHPADNHEKAMVPKQSQPALLL